MLKDDNEAAMPTQNEVDFLYPYLMISGITHPCETVMVSKSLIGL